MREGLSFEDALQIIATLPPAKRRLLCATATEYFASTQGKAMMETLGNLPRNHPRLLQSGQRMAHWVVWLVIHGQVWEQVFDRSARKRSAEILTEENT